ncbi:MAG: hypothetical protein HDS82_00070 [Bacteroidales bacterium]|nr:hypothetical protein [Bacteroidales bacterium]
MIYVFKMVSDEADNFRRTFEIDSDATFLDLRTAILKSVGYSEENMDSFFLCESDWSRQQEITLEDMGTSSDMDCYLMKDTVIGDLIEDEGQRLEFVFDYLTDRCFFMELKDTRPGEHLAEAKCTFSSGTAPRQSIDLDEFDKTIDAAMNNASELGIFDEDFGDGYNEGDLDDLENIAEDQL